VALSCALAYPADDLARARGSILGADDFDLEPQQQYYNAYNRPGKIKINLINEILHF